MAEQSPENVRTRTETETEFLRDGEWLPYVVIHRGEIGRVKCRHRVVTITTHKGEWQQGRAPGRIPGYAGFPVHLGRKGDPIFTECDIDRANARRWTWDREDVTCEKCLTRTTVSAPATSESRDA